jgi:hypothetical protein
METIEASGKPFIYTMEFFDMLADSDLEEAVSDEEE